MTLQRLDRKGLARAFRKARRRSRRQSLTVLLMWAVPIALAVIVLARFS